MSSTKGLILPVQSASRQRPLHHFGVGKRCEALCPQLRQQTVELDAFPGVILEPSVQGTTETINF